PWAIKGVIGVISDAYPLAGYHKASYILVTACIGTVALFLLATLDINSVSQAAGLMFFVNLEIATCDLLCEGKYAEYMQEKPKTGSAMVSYVWGCFQFGSLIAACFVGPVADHFNPQVSQLTTVQKALGPVDRDLSRFLKEERKDPHPRLVADHPLSSHRGLHGCSPSKRLVLESYPFALDSNCISPENPGESIFGRCEVVNPQISRFFFSITLDSGPRRPLRLELSYTKVYEPYTSTPRFHTVHYGPFTKSQLVLRQLT
ncbi:BT1 family-domain-containing protein, partial [Baffinella frigidus]